MPMHRFKLADLPAMPWKNGGGSTTELWCEPPGAGLDDFVWRVSVACIASDGPFSVFSGVDRVIALLHGQGVQLNSPQGQTLATLSSPLEPYAFAGETPIHALRLGGDSSDFNVMTRRGKASSRVQVLHPNGEARQTFVAQQGLVLCVPLEVDRTKGSGPVASWQGQWAGAESAQSLEPGEGLFWYTHPDATNAMPHPPVWTWQSAPGSALLAVAIDRMT